MWAHWLPLNVSILCKHLRNASQVWVVARQSGPGVGSGEGGDRGAVEVVGVARVVTDPSGAVEW